MSVSDSPQRNIDTHTLGGRRHSGQEGSLLFWFGLGKSTIRQPQDHGGLMIATLRSAHTSPLSFHTNPLQWTSVGCSLVGVVSLRCTLHC